MHSSSRRLLLKGGAALVGTSLGMPPGLAAGTAGLPNAGSAISTPRPEARAAAAAILQQGGNAIDAAVAAVAALCVVEPGNVGLAGYGGSMVIHLAHEGRTRAIDFDSRAPLAFRADTFNETDATFGYLAVGVPGVVAGLDLALGRYGTLPWRTVAAHALELAENGFVISARLHAGLENFARHADPVSVRALLPSGVPAEGERWAQKDLARVIRAISNGGAEAFYRGDPGRLIVRHVRDHGGVLSDEDFRQFGAGESDPLSVDYRGLRLYTPPVPSAGLTALSILKTLEQFDLASLKDTPARYYHLLAQASKLAWQERFRWLGDPDFVQFPAQELLSAEAAARRAALIRGGKVAPVAARAPEPLHTVNVVVVDRHRNVVSVTATQGGGFGSRVVVPGTGLVLGHGMSRFDLTPGPNFPAPGKRMQHNMAPMLALRDGKPVLGFGLPGGRMIVTVTSQLAVNVIDFGHTAVQAVSAPRIHNEGGELVKVSPQVAPEAVRELESLGHKVERAATLGGPANMVRIDPAGGALDAASEAGPSGVQVT
jgi:gamma-glutamyltranspeptidase/glutathione hydrolase